MKNTLKAASTVAFLGMAACTPKPPELKLPAKRSPLPEFTQTEEHNVLATIDFFECLMDNHGASLVHSPWFSDLLESCADVSDLSEDMLHDVLEQIQHKYGHSWPDMASELTAKEHYSFVPDMP